MTPKEMNALESALIGIFDRLILNAIAKLQPKNGLQEPDYVAALTEYFTADLATILNLVFPKYDFTVSGVFCHQKPIVDIHETKKPELGDILFVYSETQPDGSIQYNSLLLQAKITSQPVMRVPSGDLHQLKLYKEWPTFTYYRANFLNGQTRNIQPKAINDGAQYLLIDNNPLTNGLNGIPNTYPMGCAIANDTLILDKSLSAELFDFFKFKSGRVFEENPLSTQDDWTKMIWDLLLMGAYNYNRSNIGMNNAKRGVYCSNKAGFDQTAVGASLNQYFGAFEDNNLNDYPRDNDGMGISVVVIERGIKK